MAERNYWQRMRRQRLSRRSLLGASARAGVGAAGLALVGCGDDDDDDAQQQAQPSTSAAPAQQQQQQQAAAQQQQQAQQQADAAAQQEAQTEDDQQARQAAAQAAAEGGWPTPGQGGSSIAPYVGLSSGNPPTLDPYENLTYRAQHAGGYHYSKLLREIEGAPGVDPINGSEVTGDAAPGVPEIVDPTTYIFSIRDDIFWHDVEPLNGRQMTIDDILATQQRFVDISANSASWGAVVDSFEGGEDRTIKIGLSRPHAPFLTLVSSSQHLLIVPQEIVDDGTVAERPVGSGPWIFEEFEPDVALRWRRNENWHIKAPDGSALPLCSNITATMNANPDVIISSLAGGGLDYSSLSGSTFALMKEQVQDRDNYAEDDFFVFTKNTVPGGFYFNFSIAPWNDPRMRVALSRALDRDGVQAQTDDTGRGGWHSAISQLPPFWLDPKDLSAFGEQFEGVNSGVNFHVDIGEARKLMDAAGYPDGVQANCHNTADYGASANNFFEACVASVLNAGFLFEIDSKEYAAYIASTFRGNFPDDWDGQRPDIAIGPLYGGALDPEDLFAACYDRTSGRHNWGSSNRVAEDSVSDLDTGGNAPAWFHPDAAIGGGPQEDERLHDMFAQQRAILDLDERIEYINDIQRYMATQMYLVPYPANAGVWAVNPWVKHLNYDRVNIKATYGRGNAFIPMIWIDEETKANT